MVAPPEPLDTRPCHSCPGAGCCFGYRVAVSAVDLHRMVQQTQRSPLEFAFLLPGKDTDGILLGADGVSHELVLQKRETEGGANRCVWLERAEGHWSCAAHGARPMVCRSFPLRPVTGGGFTLLGEPCPDGAWTAEHVDAQAGVELHALWQTERDTSAEFVRRWNRIAACAPEGRRRSPRMFFYWLMAVFDAGGDAGMALMDEALVQVRERDASAGR